MSNTQFDIQQAVNDAKRVALDPFGFYRDLALTGGYTQPLLFVVCMALAMAVISIVLSIVGLGIGATLSFATLVFLPVAAVIGSFIGGAIMYVIWKLMGSDKEYEAAYRCVAYSFAIAPVVAILSIVPYLGTLIRALWMGLLMFASSTQAMGIKADTTKIGIGILTVLLVLGGINGERQARKFQAWQERVGYSEQDLEEKLQNMTAEDAGEMVGDFLKGLEKAAKEAEKSD